MKHTKKNCRITFNINTRRGVVNTGPYKGCLVKVVSVNHQDVGAGSTLNRLAVMSMITHGQWVTLAKDTVTVPRGRAEDADAESNDALLAEATKWLSME